MASEKRPPNDMMVSKAIEPQIREVIIGGRMVQGLKMVNDGNQKAKQVSWSPVYG
jgi:hypothetical protein